MKLNIWHKTTNSFDAKCRETPENCMLCMVSAHDKAGVTLANAEFASGWKKSPKQFQVQETGYFTIEEYSVYIQDYYTVQSV